MKERNREKRNDERRREEKKERQKEVGNILSASCSVINW